VIVLDKTTAEIHLEATKGAHVDDVLFEAIVLALTENCRVVVRHNDRMYPLNPWQIIEDAKRRLEGGS
jgi:hypothetical protein